MYKPNFTQFGQEAWTVRTEIHSHLLNKYILTVTEQIFTELTPAGQFFEKLICRIS